jgi:hypothetical protein
VHMPSIHLSLMLLQSLVSWQGAPDTTLPSGWSSIMGSQSSLQLYAPRHAVVGRSFSNR